MRIVQWLLVLLIVPTLSIVARADDDGDDDAPTEPTLAAEGAIHNGEIKAWDAKAEKITVSDGATDHVLGTHGANTLGKIKVGKHVDVTYSADQASNILVLD